MNLVSRSQSQINGHIARAEFDTRPVCRVRAVDVAEGVLQFFVAVHIRDARLSRGDEYEADAYASALLIKAGIGTAPQKSLFAKPEDLTQQRAGAVPAWLLSHPKTADRIKAIEANEARWASVTAE